MRIVQVEGEDGRSFVAVAFEPGTGFVALREVSSTYDLARLALSRGMRLVELARSLAEERPLALDKARLLQPLDHPDPAHCVVTGTGLTHLGSADARDRMHQKLSGPEELTDSMKMFKMGLEGGKPGPGQLGVQPEWFYKGDGSCIAKPDGEIRMPAFALDGGEEPEIVGLYVIGDDGTPWRVGFALGNEFSDHVMERQNYLYLAHSKLRACSFGPEILVGELPQDVRGASRIRRGGDVIWEKPFLSGEANMSHSIANLEHHHFKYAQFRRPGDVHVHFFGTATLSFADGVKPEPGDMFEIEAAPFTLPLRNRLAPVSATPVGVERL